MPFGPFPKKKKEKERNVLYEGERTDFEGFWERRDVIKAITLKHMA